MGSGANGRQSDRKSDRQTDRQTEMFPVDDRACGVIHPCSSLAHQIVPSDPLSMTIPMETHKEGNIRLIF